MLDKTVTTTILSVRFLRDVVVNFSWSSTLANENYYSLLLFAFFRYRDNTEKDIKYTAMQKSRRPLQTSVSGKLILFNAAPF